MRSALHSAVRQELIDRMSLSSYRFLGNASGSCCPERARRLGDFSNSHARTPIRSTPHTCWCWFLVFAGARFSAWPGRPSISRRALVPDHQLQRVRRSLYRETKTEASDAWLPMPEIAVAALVPDHQLQRVKPLVENLNMTLTGHFAVGVTGFEPATSSSRTKRATKLRHTPRSLSLGESSRSRCCRSRP